MGESRTDNIERTIRLLDIALTIGKHLLHIVWVIFGITVASAIFDFATANIFWGIIASIFAIADFIFIAQVYERRSRHRQRRIHARISKARQGYQEAAST